LVDAVCGLKRMSVEAVIFDLDGTLIEADLRMREAKREFLRRLRKLGMSFRPIDARRPAETIMTYLERYHKADRGFLLKVLEESFKPYELEAAEQAKPRAGVREVLGKLELVGCKLGLASNNSRRSVEMVLEKLGVKSSFNAIVTRDDARRLKPHEEILIKAVKRLGAAPWRSLYVGDSAADVIAGKRAGVHVAAIVGGADSRDKLLRSRPNYLIERLDEVLEIVRVLERRTF